MPSPDLFGHKPFVVAPQPGLRTPRLWVRRLAVWKQPGAIVRDVRLRPGFNVVWSPDGADVGGDDGREPSLGHGSGKTLFCRLLRYCLGEERFAAEDQRSRIMAAFGDGMVGAEVVVDGTVWAILRPLGLKRRHVAVAGGDLDTIAGGEGSATGLAAFLDAVSASFVPLDIAPLFPEQGGKKTGWLAALAWAARDQECRFGSVLGWRDPGSGSESPVGDWSAATRADAIRAFLRAITVEEQTIRGDKARLKREHDAAGQRADRLVWQAQELRIRLRRDLGLPETEQNAGELDVEAIQQAAREKYEATASLPQGAARLDENRAKQEFDHCQEEFSRLGAELAAASAHFVDAEQLIPKIRAELPALSYEEFAASNVPCKICGVPISQALATKCGLSEVFHDLDEVRARHQTRYRELAEEEQRLEHWRREKGRLTGEHETASKRLQVAKERHEALVRAERSRNAEWYAARRLADDADRLAQMQLEEKQQRLLQARLLRELEAKGEQGAAHRDLQEQALRRLGEAFDAIVRDLVGPNASGRFQFHAKGLSLKVDLGGERSTAAIDTLKVIAFDLAALCLSVEGKSAMPAFLIHDSPREADLGRSHYNQIFHFARALESQGKSPLFQYIVTTTSAPPREFRNEPWLRLTLRGSPGESRLLGQDL